jgi:hypothetical protein
MSGINELLLIAHGLIATTYGYNELNCGDVGKARPCSAGAITASGEYFEPTKATAAIAAPADFVLDGRYIFIRTAISKCVKVRLNDKMNERYIGERGFDLTPEAVRLLTNADPTPYWSDQVYLCRPYNEEWEQPIDFARQL